MFRDVGRLAIPKPCQQNWDEMSATSGGRFCESCQKTVQDLSGLTRREAMRRVRESEGGLCGRIRMDASGDPIFRPEQSDLGRLVRISLLGASGVAFAQSAASTCKVEVKVVDATNAAISNATVRFSQAGHEAVDGTTNASGVFQAQYSPGTYSLEVASPGFAHHTDDAVRLSCSGEATKVIPIRLDIGSVGGVAFIEPQKSPLPGWPSLKSAVRSLRRKAQ